MPVDIRGKTYYRTSEAARMAGISRSTLLRWEDGGLLKTEPHRDRRGWRLFTRADIAQLRREASSFR